MTDENPFVKDHLTDTEQLVRQLEYLTGHKVHISDDPAPHLVKLREAVKRESKQLHTVLTEIRDDLIRHGDHPESLAAAVTRLWEMEPFDLQFIPGRDYGDKWKSLGNVHIVSRWANLPITAHGHGETPAQALRDALEDATRQLWSYAAGERMPQGELPW